MIPIKKTLILSSLCLFICSCGDSDSSSVAYEKNSSTEASSAMSSMGDNNSETGGSLPSQSSTSELNSNTSLSNASNSSTIGLSLDEKSSIQNISSIEKSSDQNTSAANSSATTMPSGACPDLSTGAQPISLPLGTAQSYTLSDNESICFVLNAQNIQVNYDSLKFQVFGKAPKPQGQVKLSAQDPALTLGSTSLTGSAETMNIKLPLGNSHQKFAPYYAQVTMTNAGQYNFGWALNNENPQSENSSSATLSSSQGLQTGSCTLENSKELTKNVLWEYAAEANSTHCFRVDAQTEPTDFSALVVRFSGVQKLDGKANIFATDPAHAFTNPTEFNGTANAVNLNLPISKAHAQNYGPYYFEVTFTQADTYKIGWALNANDFP